MRSIQNQNQSLEKFTNENNNNTKNVFKANEYKKDRNRKTDRSLIFFFAQSVFYHKLWTHKKWKKNHCNAIEMNEYDKKNRNYCVCLGDNENINAQNE